MEEALTTGYTAAKYGSFLEMRTIVEQHTEAAVAYKDSDSKYTYLHQVAWHGNVSEALWLVARGASATARNRRNETPAETATRRGYVACAQVLEAAASISECSATQTSAADTPILVISDPHGNLSLVLDALQRGARAVGRPDLTVVLLGDFCDNGPEIPALLDFLCGVNEAGGKFGPMTFLPILGNHDMACLLALEPTAFGSTPTATTWWQRWHRFWNPGYGTPELYGCSPGCSVDAFRDAFPADHKRFLLALPWHVDLDGYVFVHAGLHEDTAAHPLDAQLAFLRARDLSRLAASGFESYKGGGYGMPDHITNKEWKAVSTPRWGRIVVTGHNKYGNHADLVTPHRLGLHSAACVRRYAHQGSNSSQHRVLSSTSACAHVPQ